MGKPLSNDLRSRVVQAVASGLTRRKAAAQFGVSAASAVRWVEAVRVSGSVEPKPQGGDTRSHRIEVFSAVLLAAVAVQKDITLAELAELLLSGHGASFGASSVWRCLNRHGLSYKKQRTLPSRNDPTSQPGAAFGSGTSLTSILSTWCSSTRRALRRRWLVCVAGPCGVSGAGPPCRTDTGRPRPSPARCAWAA